MVIDQIGNAAIGWQQIDNSTVALIKYENNMISEYKTTLTTRIGRVH